MLERLFSAASLAAMVGWLGLALAAATPPGRWRAALMAFAGRGVPVVLCAAYACLLVVYWGSAPGGGFSSLAAVMALFSVPGKMLGGWLHFLAFDLLVGHWLVAQVLASGRSRWGLLAVLPATFLFGPLGVLLHLLWGRMVGAPR